MHTLPDVLIGRSVKTYCKSFNNMPLTVLIAEWLERHAGKQGVAGSIPGRCVYFCLLSVAHSTAETILMNSSKTFIQSNGCTEINLILKKNYGGSLYYDTSALNPTLHIERRRSDGKAKGLKSKGCLFKPIVCHSFFLKNFPLLVSSLQVTDWSWRMKQSILVWDEILIFSLFEVCLYRKGPALIDRSI